MTVVKKSRAGLANFTDKAGAAAVGARLRRLSERIDREATELYAELGVKFEQRWFGTMNLLDLYGPLTVGELAQALGITHVSVSQTRDSLQRSGLTTSDVDPSDGRRRTVRLTKEGKALVARLKPLWTALSQAAAELDQEAGDVLAALERLERALERSSLSERVRRLLRK
ncbi:MarR family winged helix-turn-helix transcriptional regulator [Hyalangium rubrum]|uniref:MarR family transcriptional regulator n=1 Tax=Hyalangium rubrum TaxID=3103134 RepID=A0ABU5HIQ7_9BACT|nr:MarR family transcriptional regulator [Hyalangium sp. s54d21]MDY7233329.1 MarR family transcriptional regulator [Hyalangium sp. s54d21]